MSTWADVYECEQTMQDYAQRLEATAHPWATKARRDADGYSREVRKWESEAAMQEIQRKADADVRKMTEGLRELFDVVKFNVTHLNTAAAQTFEAHADVIDDLDTKVAKMETAARTAVAKAALPVTRTSRATYGAKGRIERVDVYEGDRLVARKFPVYDAKGRTVGVREEAVR